MVLRSDTSGTLDDHTHSLLPILAIAIPTAMATKISSTVRDEARFMSLDGVAKSPEALGVVDGLASGFARRKGPRAPGKKLERAIGAALCDFLQAEGMSAGRWSHRARGAGDFSGERIGYKVFIRAIDEMIHHNMAEKVRGHQQWTQSAFGPGPKVRDWAKAARVRPTEWLLRFMAERGITSANWAEHFPIIVPDEATVKHPLVLRRRNLNIRNDRFRGYGMTLDMADPTTQSHFDRIDRLNRHFALTKTEPVPFLGFKRIFNNGDVPGFDWNLGGRLYAVGGGYQTMKKKTRPQLTIDGEATGEVDVRASHLTILAHLRGLAPYVAQDPYHVDGLPRDVVKKFVTMTLGHTGFHRAWPKGVLERFEPIYGHPLRATYPVRVVREKVLAAIPALRNWGEDDTTSLHLQFIESEALLLAVERLAYRDGIVSLPLHDSLIAPLSQLEKAKAALSEAYREVVGVTPMIKERKSSSEGAGGNTSPIPRLGGERNLTRVGEGYTTTSLGKAKGPPATARYTRNLFMTDLTAKCSVHIIQLFPR